MAQSAQTTGAPERSPQDLGPPPGPNPFATDRDDELPVGVQVKWRLRALIATGRLRAGERLPSFRRLADWAGVNVGTVRTVYEDLEQDGLVVTRQGQGTFVADGVEAQPELEEIATDALIRAYRAGLKPCEMAMVAVVCASIGSDLMGRLPADVELAPPLGAGGEEDGDIEVRHELRRQIGRLEAELGAYARDLPDLPTAPRRAEAHVAGVGELERTRDTLIAQLSEAQRAAEQRARREADQRLRRQRRAGGGDVDVPAVGPLARAMGWWRSKT